MRRMAKHFIVFSLTIIMACFLAGYSWAYQEFKMVEIDFWHATSDKPSMGNIATDNNNKALYNPQKNTLQIGTNPVDIGGYISAIAGAEFDKTGQNGFEKVKKVSTKKIETGTKNDGKNHEIEYLSSFEIELPAYIKKEGVEYIPFKVSVPHTPMDSVMENGYIEARLRIDWNHVENGKIDFLDVNDAISRGKVENINKINYVTGVLLNTDSTKVSKETKFSVKQIEKGDVYKSAEKTLLGTLNNFSLYEVKLHLNNREVAPNGSVQITFPYKGSGIKLYRINDDGKKTKMRGVSSEDGYTILTTKIGRFAISGGKKIDTNPFADTKGHKDEEPILRLFANGIVQGLNQNTYLPDQHVGYETAVLSLYNISESKKDKDFEKESANVKKEKAIKWHVQNGIAREKVYFEGVKNINKEEAVCLLYNLYKIGGEPKALKKELKAKDIAMVSDWAKDAIFWANEMKIINLTDEMKICPKENLTRAQWARILCRYLDLSQ